MGKLLVLKSVKDKLGVSQVPIHQQVTDSSDSDLSTTCLTEAKR